MTEDQMKQRTKQFALRVMRLAGALPRNTAAQVIGKQLVRAGTSVGANYRAACRGRSKAEFVAKLGIAQEEADECWYWLELVTDGMLLSEARVRDLRREASELLAIITASRITASRSMQSKIESRKSKMPEGL